MRLNRRFLWWEALSLTLVITLTGAVHRLRADTGTCGGASTTLPFTDVMSSGFFCQIAAAFFTGLTSGTSATTYSPGNNVTREQMAAFITRTLDQSLKRGSRRAALDQYWTPTDSTGLGLTTVGDLPLLVASDGADLWVANASSNSVSRVRASDGKKQDPDWTGATAAAGVLVAKGLIFVTGQTNPGKLYQINPSQPAGAVTPLTNSLGAAPAGIAFDGARVWTANFGPPGSVSIVTLTNPVSVTTVTTGFSEPVGILYDGANIWVTDAGDNTLKKLDSNGNVLQPPGVTVGGRPEFPVFDGTNIWVPSELSNTVTVVRAASGAVLATLSGNGLDVPAAAAFDGQRILVTNQGGGVSLWKAADLTPLSLPSGISMGTGTNPFGACSDGLNFWVTLKDPDPTIPGKLARF